MKKLFIIIPIIVVVGFLLFSNDDDYKIKNAQPTGETIVAFGDSLTYGTGAPKGHDYPSILSNRIGEKIINLGKPGDTTEDGLKRVDDVLAENPRIVLITLGGNDLKNGRSKEQAFRNLKIIVEKIQQSGALVIIGAIDIPFYGKGFNKAYHKLGRETGSVIIPNIYDGVIGRKGLMSDPIHPNKDGYKKFADYFYEAIKEYL